MTNPTIDEFYGPNLMKSRLEKDIENFSNFTKLPKESFPIWFASHTFSDLYKKFNEGNTEEKITAKKKLGKIWMGAENYFMCPTGDEDVVNTKNAIFQAYTQTLPLIHSEKGKEIVNKSTEPLTEIAKKYTEVKALNDENEKKGAEAYLDLMTGANIYSLYGEILEKEPIVKLNKLTQAMESKDESHLADIVKESTKEIGGRYYNDLITSQVLRDPGRKQIFLKRYQEITFREIAKDYKKDGNLDLTKLENEVYTALGKAPGNYKILVDKIYTIEAKKAEASQEE